MVKVLGAVFFWIPSSTRSMETFPPGDRRGEGGGISCLLHGSLSMLFSGEEGAESEGLGKDRGRFGLKKRVWCFILSIFMFIRGGIYIRMDSPPAHCPIYLSMGPCFAKDDLEFHPWGVQRSHKVSPNAIKKTLPADGMSFSPFHFFTSPAPPFLGAFSYAFRAVLLACSLPFELPPSPP